MHPQSDSIINIEILIRKGCPLSERTGKAIKEICGRFEQVRLSIYDISINPAKRPSISITPSVWANDELWYLGSFDPQGFEQKLLHLTVQDE